jgi:hypothetical protein
MGTKTINNQLSERALSRDNDRHSLSHSALPPSTNAASTTAMSYPSNFSSAVVPEAGEDEQARLMPVGLHSGLGAMVKITTPEDGGDEAMMSLSVSPRNNNATVTQPNISLSFVESAASSSSSSASSAASHSNANPPEPSPTMPTTNLAPSPLKSTGRKNREYLKSGQVPSASSDTCEKVCHVDYHSSYPLTKSISRYDSYFIIIPVMRFLTTLASFCICPLTGMPWSRAGSLAPLALAT